MKQEMLGRFKNLLCARLEEILANAGGFALRVEVNASNPDPMDEADLACARNEREISMHIHHRNRRSFQEIIESLERLRQGEFGICEECGSEIELRRLEAHPTATVCIECKRRIEALNRLKAA